MMLLGDIAVDDREDRINMHRSDYMLRDVSKDWRELSANVPLYATWDDHDYLNNDLSGIPERFTAEGRDALRKVWEENWNNPEHDGGGIYFNTRTGPVEIIMLDTRSCRKVELRGDYGSYLGMEQLDWLKETLKNSTAPFKIISSGTMWSDYISNGKDSWGTWDTCGREEIFSFIEKEKIPGVVLVSGDRHGARGFIIPRPSGFVLHEFEAATLGGVPGPDAMAEDGSNQMFGYPGADLCAFGEFTFTTNGSTEPSVTFRLIDEAGCILEEHIIQYKMLTPGTQ
jgi:alkaline phosphatase D